MIQTEQELIQDRVTKDIARYKSRHPDITSEEEEMLLKEFTRILTDLIEISKKEKKTKKILSAQKNVQKNSKKQQKMAQKLQKNAVFLSKNSNEYRHTVETNDISIKSSLISCKSDSLTKENKQSDFQLKTLKKTREDYYNKAVWKTLSRLVRDEHKVCLLCNKNPATEVHHLVKFYNQDTELLRNELLLDEDNLICLCNECHHNVHNNKLDVLKQIVINNKRDKINMKYFNIGKFLNMSDICFLKY